MTTLFDSHGYDNASDFDLNVVEITEDDARAMQPKDQKNITLKPHQLALLKRCRDLESKHIVLQDYGVEQAHSTDVLKTRLGIIGDQVGSGKSYVILALMSEAIDCDEEESNSVIKSFAGNMVTFTLQEKKVNINTNLLVIPHNLTSQWSSYITLWGGAKPLYVNKKTMNDIIEGTIIISDYHLVVVTSTYYNRLAAFCMDEDFKFQRVFFDEVDNLNMPGCKTVSAKFTWLISASYGNILYPRGYTKWDNSLHRYVWCAAGITNSGYIKNILQDMCQSVPRTLTKLLVLKNQASFIDKSNILPPFVKHIIKCKTPRSIHVLNGIVDRNIIECLNANDIAGAISQVNPANKGSEDNIIDILVQKYNKFLVNLKIKLQYTEECIFDTPQERETELNKIKQKIDEAARKVALISERVKQADICTICYDDITNKTITRCCQNSFCFRCINLWLERSHLCPMCKTVLQASDIFSVVDQAQSEGCSMDAMICEDCMNEKNDKYQNVRLLLEKRAPGTKFLIFSNFDNSFVPLYPILYDLHINYMYLKGNGNVIKSIIDKYKTGDVDVLLVNSRHNGCGLNLENTTDMIMFHKFDTQIEHQVVGRAHRLGRTNPLNVWYFLHENECTNEQL